MQLDLYTTVPIVLGSILMVVNIIRYFLFIKNTHDVLSAGSVRDCVWKTVAGVLLVFFLFGYLFCAFVGEPDIVMALIPFGGSVLFRHSAGEFRGRGGFQLLRRERLVIEKWSRIAQFRIMEIQPTLTFEEDPLEGSDRGGFGSTGIC